MITVYDCWSNRRAKKKKFFRQAKTIQLGTYNMWFAWYVTNGGKNDQDTEECTNEYHEDEFRTFRCRKVM